MSMNKIFCVGDGYAHGHIWPEWPQILQCLCPDHKVEVVSAIGAGSEFLVSELLARSVERTTVIFQWPQSNRFDKLLVDNSWDTIIDSDHVYRSNVYSGLSGKWWCSSASQIADVVAYRRDYITQQQSELRNYNFKVLIQAWLEKNQTTWMFTSTQEQAHYAQQPRFRNIRSDEVQPHPMVHYWFLVEKIAPAVNLVFDAQRQMIVKQRLEAINWKPYHPDRQELLESIMAV
jgi:hypothetical protein